MTGNNLNEIRKFYGQRGLGGAVGFGERPAIVVVDFILGFTDRSSPLSGDLEQPLTETLRLLDEARKRSVPIFFTTVEYDESLKDAGLFVKKVPSLKWLVRGTRWVELDPRLARRPGEILLRKKYASAFFGTDFASLLVAAAVDTLIITGCTTSGCIRATAIDALQYGLRAIVPAEAVGDRAQMPHEANLFDIDAKYGDVVAVEEVLRYLRRIQREETSPPGAAGVKTPGT
jgi:maleamate amidohydrolase